MKILLVSEYFPYGKDLRFSGGVEARTFFIAKHLAKKHKVYIRTSRVAKAKAKEKMHNFEVIRVGPVRHYNPTVGSIFSRIMFVKDAIKVGRSLEVDVIDGSNVITHYIARSIAQKNRLPYVLWYPDVWLGKWIKNAGFWGIFGEIVERLNLTSAADAYIAISKETAKKLSKHVSKKINIIPCGVDRAEFLKPVKKFNTPTIITISRLAKYKNLKTLILAFAHLNTKIKDSRLIIVGEGPQFKSLKNLATALRLSSKITFFSNLPRRQLIELIKKSHIFSLPSLVEGFGIVTIEASVAGLPYVNSNIPIQREITNDGEGGFLVNPHDPYTFSKNFLKLFNDHSTYKKKSFESTKMATKYSWASVSKQTEQVYKNLI